MAAVAPLLTTRQISRQFGGLMAVDRVDFAVSPGEVHAIIGPNGAGKTTLVNLICGRLTPSHGTVWFAGEDITRLPAYVRVRKGMAYTFQITSIFGHLSCADNVALAVQRARIPLGHSRQRWRRAGGAEQVAAALGRVGLADRADMPAGALSYGHQRLLEVAMGVALRPKLLILDEPTQGLSNGEIELFGDLVRGLASETTILLIEHNMPVVMALSTRITVLHNGVILAEGTPGEIRANEAVQSAYLGSAC